MATISAFNDGLFATYNLTVGPYNALLGIFNNVTPASNTALNFVLNSQTVTGVTTFDMAVGCPCFSRNNTDNSPMTASAPWPTVTGINVPGGSFTISSPAIQAGTGYAAFGLLNDGTTGVGHLTASMTFPAGFPAGTQWGWNFPNEYQSGVYGYPDLCFGQGAPGYYPVPPNLPRPLHPNDFGTLSLDFAFSANITVGGADAIDCLIETWAVNKPSPQQGDAPACLMNEIGFLAYCGPTLWTFVKSLPHNFSAVVGGYNVYVATRAGTPGTASPPFTIIVPTTPDFSTPVSLIDGAVHTIDFKAMLRALVTNGLLSNTNWIVGYALGPEIYQGAGTATVSTFNWTWLPAGAFLPTTVILASLAVSQFVLSEDHIFLPNVTTQASGYPVRGELVRVVAASPNSSMTLRPVLSGDGSPITWVVNETAQTINVFCAVGEKLGGVLNSSLSIPAGAVGVFFRVDNVHGGPDWRASAVA